MRLVINSYSTLRTGCSSYRLNPETIKAKVWFLLVSSGLFILSQWRQSAWTCSAVEYIGLFPDFRLKLNVCVTHSLSECLAYCLAEQFTDWIDSGAD